MAVLRPHTRIIQARSNRVHGGGIARFVLQKIAVKALNHAGFAQGHGGGMAAGLVEPFAGRLHAHQGHGFIIEKRVKQAQSIGAAADAGHHFIGQAAISLLKLRPRFVADDALKISHHFGIRRRPHHRADGKHGVFKIGHIGAKSAVHRLFERARPFRHRHELGTENFHARHIRMLFGHVHHAHVDFAFQPQQRSRRGQRHAMLAGAGFSHHFFLAEFFRQQHFADAVVDFVRTGVVEVFALEVNLRAALRQRAGMVNRAGAADISGLKPLHFSDKCRIADDAAKACFDFGQRHRQIGMVDFAAVRTEKALRIGQHQSV